MPFGGGGSVVVPSVPKSGQVKVAVTGTAVQFGSNTITEGILITANLGNVAKVVIGPSGVANTTGVTNGKQGAAFSGDNMVLSNFASAFNNATRVIFTVVFKLNGTGANGQFFNCFDNSYTYPRFRPFLSAAQPAFASARLDSTADDQAYSSTTLSVGTIYVTEYDYNPVTAKITITVNGADTNIANTTHGTAGNYANTTLNEPKVGASLDATVLDWALNINGTQSAGQKTSFRNAIKTKFGLTF